jgi:hypothetical protein
MTQRTASEMYRDLRAAGFSRASAIIMVAIGLGESGGNDDAVGDVGLEDSTWGPSVGIYQVRTEKGATGSGGDRDIAALMGDEGRQAKAAYDISSHGTDFTPWTVFTTGAYQEHLAQAQAAADSAATSGYVTVGDGVGDVLGGIIPNPIGPDVSAVEGALGSALGNLVPSFRDGAVMLAFAGLGMALVGLGLMRAVAPAVGRGVKTVAGAVT